MKAIRNLVCIPFGFMIGLAVDGFDQPRAAGAPMAAIHVATAWGATLMKIGIQDIGLVGYGQDF